jgi:hypothetical protein
MAPAKTQDVRAWLAPHPPLSELREAYPDEWQTVQAELAGVVARGDLEELKAHVLAESAPQPAAPRAERRRRGEEAVLAEEIRREMTAAALKKICLSAATGVKRGKVRFNLVNGYLAQKLLFRKGLERKPVSLARFRLVWPLLTQKQLLMPLVEPKGIYCFYSGKLVKELAKLIGDRPALEIAAGDGTLARFLRDAGADVVATDDRSWDHSVDYPEDVLQQDASRALREHRPRVVICSWPPAGNSFERDVFKTSSVETYVVIASKHRFASGNWADYEAQSGFELSERPDLGRLVLPPELEAAVYTFERSKPMS